MRFKYNSIIFSIFVSLSFAIACSAADLKPLQDWMQSLVDDNKVVGCMAQITQDGNTIYLEAIGKRSPEAEDLLLPTQVVRIYSMTKAITSVAIMQLVEQGLIGIDDPVSFYIPEFADVKILINGEFKPPNKEVTVRELITHTSGLGYSFSATDEFLPYYREDIIDDKTLENAAKKIAGMPLISQPGSKFIYGLGIDVLGRIIEVVSGSDFESYLRKHIFMPLGMVDTGFTPMRLLQPMPIVTEINGNLVVDNIHYSKSAYELNPNYASGGGGLWSTIGDYTRFIMAIEQNGELEGNRILGSETVNFMIQNQISPGINRENIENPIKFSLGFGIRSAIETSSGLRGEGRLAWGGAACSYFFIDPSQNVTAVFATQLFPFNSQLNDEFHYIVLESLAQEDVNAGPQK